MGYKDTWFGKIPFHIYSGRKFDGRTYWLHKSVRVFSGELVPMNEANPDGSITVLGALEYKFRDFPYGVADKSGLQKSLEKFTEELRKYDGVRIVKKTKNILRAIYKNEKLMVAITTSANG